MTEIVCLGKLRIRLIFPSSLGFKKFNIPARNRSSKAEIRSAFNQIFLVFLKKR